MRLTAIIKNSTSYGNKKRDVILTTGASTEIGTHYYSADLIKELSSTENDIVIAGGEPLEQFFPMQTFLELVKSKTKKKVWLVTKRKVIPTKRVWQHLSRYVDTVQEYTSGKIINLRESVKTLDIVLWEE